MMLPPRLSPGDVIGLASPSHIATPESAAPVTAALTAMGYRVRPAGNLFADGWGYSATEQERAEDLNQLIRDPEVKLILFGGGEGADEVLPYLDYDAARANPKLWLSFSDATSILNTVWARTGLVTYYGQMPRGFLDMDDYNRAQFITHMVEGGVRTHVPAEPWHTLHGGSCQGVLTGGYLDNYVFLACNGYVKPAPGVSYLLFIEDNEAFFQIPHVSDLLARLEQSPMMRQCVGLIFGHYSVPINAQLLERLTRLGEKHSIPVCYCDDFGHGVHHAILPIGVTARLDADGQTLTYLG